MTSITTLPRSGATIKPHKAQVLPDANDHVDANRNGANAAAAVLTGAMSAPLGGLSALLLAERVAPAHAFKALFVGSALGGIAAGVAYYRLASREPTEVKEESSIRRDPPPWLKTTVEGVANPLAGALIGKVLTQRNAGAAVGAALGGAYALARAVDRHS